MRILITGATGFVGGHLIEKLLDSSQHELHGLSRRAIWPAHLQHLAGRASLHAVDLLDRTATEDLLRDLDPKWIFHLAGYANTAKSYGEPEKAWESNLQATDRLYDAIARSGYRPRVLFTSTGLVYGNPSGGDQLCSESDLIAPAGPYAASKAAADLLSAQVTFHLGLDVIRVRCFNQIGPRQSADYATANFARQIALIERGSQPAIMETGDLSSQRDLTDVRDMVRAFVLLMERGLSGEAYNAGSGIALSMQTVLDRMLALARTPIEVRQRSDPARLAETAVSRANVKKIRDATDWQPEYTLDQSLADVLDYWRNEVQRPTEGATS